MALLRKPSHMRSLLPGTLVQVMGERSHYGTLIAIDLLSEAEVFIHYDDGTERLVSVEVSSIIAIPITAQRLREIGFLEIEPRFPLVPKVLSMASGRRPDQVVRYFTYPEILHMEIQYLPCTTEWHLIGVGKVESIHDLQAQVLRHYGVLVTTPASLSAHPNSEPSEYVMTNVN